MVETLTDKTINIYTDLDNVLDFILDKINEIK